MKSFWTFLLLIITMVTGTAQTPCPCCTDAHQQFDFWVGDWAVYDTTGKQVGENTIVKQEGNCIIAEHWRGGGGSTGRSMNYYNRADATWNQLWVDNQGNPLILKGKSAPNKMILQSELVPGQQIDFYRNRVTWTLNEDGSVTQLWEILDKADKVLTVAFLGIYKRKED